MIAAKAINPAAMAEMQKLLNRLIAKHTRSPADWRPAMARGREGQPEYGDIIQAPIGDRVCRLNSSRAGVRESRSGTVRMGKRLAASVGT